MNGTKNIWMQLLGFEKNDPDRGVKRFLDRTGFVPDNICALLFHSDFVHLHQGMEKEVPLLKANCAYRGILRNKERKRQDWTNYDLKLLIDELKKQGIGFYIGLMGSHLKNKFHHEWLTDHPELTCMKTDSEGELACLKRFKDGTYYEDFFIEKLTQTLLDYDCAGVHLSDAFCPMNQIYRGDWSSDMTEQFLMHTGITLPEEILSTLGKDGFEERRKRHEYIWGKLRSEWISFYEWRWQSFFRKVCDAVHKIGKQVWILGMYCTDPFETRYIYGFDCKKVVEAGVDCITANILPTSVCYEKPEFEYFFHRMHLDLPMLRGQLGEKGKILSMVGVQDASEEWSMLDHQPMKLERDITTTASFVSYYDGKYKRCSDGLYYCLGDGIEPSGWDFLRIRTERAFEGAVEKSWSPMVLWSDHQQDRMLKEYIDHRRPSAHKQCIEIFKAGTPLGGVVRSDALKGFDGLLFVPNYDLLSLEEQTALRALSSPWLGTCDRSFDLASTGIADTYSAFDPLGDPSLKLFAVGYELSDEEKNSLQEILSMEDPAPSRRNEPEGKILPLLKELPFGKLSCGFRKACAFLLKRMMLSVFPLESNQPMLALRLRDGRDRLFLFNPYDNGYGSAVVTSPAELSSADIKSAYPVLPPRFLSEGESGVYYDFEGIPSTRKRFVVKLAPDGVTVVDVMRAL